MEPANPIQSTPPDLPKLPVSEASAAPDLPAARPITRWRWWIHLVLLALYPLSLSLIGLTFQPRQEGPTLKADFVHLIGLITETAVVFGVFFLLAWSASRATKDQLLLRIGSIPRAIGLGLVLSIALRLLVMVFVLAVVVVTFATGGASASDLQSLRPKTETLVDIQALVDRPFYLVVNVTAISFLVAGFREELWRAGVLAGLAALFPSLRASWRGQGVAVLVTALLFGLGHLPQGAGAVVLTTVLGVGLGVIMLWRRSIWEAVFAHGFFDATTFFMLYLLQRFFPEALSGS